MQFHIVYAVKVILAKHSFFGNTVTIAVNFHDSSCHANINNKISSTYSLIDTITTPEFY